jgi:hypothetical protein
MLVHRDLRAARPVVPKVLVVQLAVGQPASKPGMDKAALRHISFRQGHTASGSTQAGASQPV